MTLTQLDRTLFEVLRLALVAGGYLPAYPPTGVLDGPTWQAALDAHTGTLIEIYGVGVPTNRGAKEGHRIVLNRKPMIRGQLGGNTPYFEKQPDDKFTKRKRALSTYNVGYEIRTVTGDVNVDRIITHLILKVLGQQAYLNIYKDDPNTLREFTDKHVFVSWDGSTDIKATDQLEQLHKYNFEDVWLGEDPIIRENIPPLIKITAEIKDLDNHSDAPDFDPNEPPTESEVIIE